jgi:hypothetical protein
MLLVLLPECIYTVIYYDESEWIFTELLSWKQSLFEWFLIARVESGPKFGGE